MIDQSQLNLLEQKISRLLHQLRDVTSQNNTMRQQIDKLNEQLANTTRELELLRQNTQTVTETKEINETMLQQREILRNTLQRVLRHVSALRSAMED